MPESGVRLDDARHARSLRRPPESGPRLHVADSSGQLHTSEDLSLLAAAVEGLLWTLWDTAPATAGYWQDGVIFEMVELHEDATLALPGVLWCGAARNQWKVPIQAILELDEAPEPLKRVRIFIGDGSRDDLRDDRAPRHFQRPNTWLIEFDVERPRDKVVDVGPLLAELRAWLDENPQGRIAGPDWAYLNADEATALVHAEAANGRLLALRKTWLDGNPTIQLTA